MSEPLAEDASDDIEIPLSRDYVARIGAPYVRRVDPRVFSLSYFQPCMGCTFCNDHCCDGGVGIDAAHIERLVAHAPGLAPYTAAPPERWFDDVVHEDPDYPSGRMIDTQVFGSSCALRTRNGRGCGIHAYTIDRGIDYHELKPIYCCLFPVTVIEGDLLPSPEVDEGDLVCAGPGATLYRGARDELAHYFGEELVAELDRLEASCRKA